ncbi:DinB family protein [Bacillus sp. CGMCC 1.16607]|uniref:DinB family protein n=1 Tax=Bacillus sp. CGMCC 1.16607 TaxID=3351842 RepID=UPI00362E8186
MNLIEIKKHYESFQEWLQSLNKLDDTKWFEPIAEGKWSTAAIVAHLLFWDKYSLNERFPYFAQGAQLDRYPNFQQVNDSAREYAHSGITKEQLIKEIIEVRQQYYQLIDQYDEESLSIAFSIGDHTLTIGEYFIDFIGHDQHHHKQIIDAVY